MTIAKSLKITRMYMIRIIVCWLVLFCANNAVALEYKLSDAELLASMSYKPQISEMGTQRPTAFEWMTSAPQNLLSFTKRIDPRENAGWWTGIVLSSAILIKYDQEIIDESQKYGRKLGLISDTKHGRETTTIIPWKLQGLDLPIGVPANLNSVLYSIGDGYPQIGLMGGLLGYGFLAGNDHALSVASQNIEALFVTGIIVQALKRSTGRQAPFVATTPGGKWQWFPNQEEYNKHVPSYDAFPSGHLATVMASTTVLAYNYPTHTYIKPVGYSLMAILGFAMLTNGVHWAGDYPVGLAIGYTAAQVAIARNEKKKITVTSAAPLSAQKRLSESMVLPFADQQGFGLRYYESF